MSQCPCGSGKTFSACCKPYLEGSAQPATAEDLMRSRYTAYVKKNIDYIQSTHSPQTRDSLDMEATREWAEESQWKGLAILNTQEGGSQDSTGTVEFKAEYVQENRPYTHHEVSRFEKIDGTWFFVDGHPARETYVREQPKVGRNDPCPCGSGKKYKKCCGA